MQTKAKKRRNPLLRERRWALVGVKWSCTAERGGRGREKLQGPPHLWPKCGSSSGQGFINGRPTDGLCRGKRSGQWQVVRGMIGSENTAGKAIEVSDDLTQLME